MDLAPGYATGSAYDMDWVDNAGRTALSVAIVRDRLEMIELLLDHGADPNFRNVVPLVLAAGSGSVGAVRMLLARHAVANS
jgi:ankyrin repeat protein